MVGTEQPYIRKLTHLAQAAAEIDRGLEFVSSVSRLIVSPEIEGCNIALDGRVSES